ncbi:NUDIX hydrolase [Actinokineospora iranica]|nr:NUDIX domain-containing protein [Actinokineospora iranica]
MLVVDDAGLVLMVRDGGGHRLPGGPQAAGETLPQAAVRAVAARTGVRAEVSELIGIYSDPTEPWSADLAVCFRGRPVSGPLRDGAVWVEPERLGELGIPAASRSVIEQGLAAD